MASRARGQLGGDERGGGAPSDTPRLTYAEPYPAAGLPPHWLRPLLPDDPAARDRLRLGLVRVLVAVNLLFGTWYIAWRWTSSINWAFWPVALMLILAETYSYLDSGLFGLTMWRWKRRGPAPPPPSGATVDVFITCYNEPVELVRRTARAARAIRWPHRTHILDDGDSAEMRAMAGAEGVGYIARSLDWRDRPRHAKAGNLINALHQTDGEFIAILDADQIAAPKFLHRTLGYFHDPQMSFVQTPQFFYNVPPDDPFGSQATLFYGPMQEGKDGWNAAFFCGSNAVLRREALMQLGLTDYVRELDGRVRRALRAAGRLLHDAERRLAREGAPEGRAREGLRELRAAVRAARRDLRAGAPIQEVTWAFQRRAEEVSRLLVAADLASIRAELADIPGLAPDDPAAADLDAALGAVLDASPLTAIAAVRGLLLGVDVDRADEAHPVLPLATVSVTEDMATAMRLHALGWRSAYHPETLVVGLAPENLRTVMQQRLRWAQGTLQVLFRENPLLRRGLAPAQRLMYFATMWSYLSGPFAVIYLLAPAGYLFFGWLPVRSFSGEFFWHLLPYLVVNELLFAFIGWGRPTWRGRQYSLALFPVWIRAIATAAGNVMFGKSLGFVVTPKTRPGRQSIPFSLVRWQLICGGVLLAAVVYGLVLLTLGLRRDWLPVLINTFWAAYDLLLLSVTLDAIFHRPAEEEADPARMFARPLEAPPALAEGLAAAAAGGGASARTHRPGPGVR